MKKPTETTWENPAWLPNEVRTEALEELLIADDPEGWRNWIGTVYNAYTGSKQYDDDLVPHDRAESLYNFTQLVRFFSELDKASALENNEKVCMKMDAEK